MVPVLVLEPFEYLGRSVSSGDWIDMVPIDAAVQSRAGLVSLSHGNAYQTREMVAADPVSVVAVSSNLPIPDTEERPVKRRRGRPRKVR